jgi:hypothetical protein
MVFWFVDSMKSTQNQTTNQEEERDSFFEEKQLQIFLLYYFVLFAGVFYLPFAFFFPKGTKYVTLPMCLFAVVFSLLLLFFWNKLKKARENVKNMKFYEMLLQLVVGVIPLITIVFLKKTLRLMLLCYIIWLFIFTNVSCKVFFDFGGDYWVMLFAILFFSHLLIPLNLQLNPAPKIIYTVISYLVLLPIIWYFYYGIRGVDSDDETSKKNKSAQMIYGTVIFCVFPLLLTIVGVIHTDYRKILPYLGFLLIGIFAIICYFKYKIVPTENT